MTGYVANTDFEWYDVLRYRSHLEEVNFWRPLDTRQIHVLSGGEPVIFNPDAEHGYRIAGFGTLLKVNLPVLEAWSVFGQANGADTESAMWDRVAMAISSGAM